jgi:2-dehydropantoate 2-reductase
MKIVVLGAGALGSITAGYLARAGADVTLIARGARAKFLAQNGVTVRPVFEGGPDFTVPVRIVEDPAALTECDAFMLTAKTYDTASALTAVRNLKPGMAFSVQNGVVKNDDLAAAFGWDHTIGCIANFSGEVQEDGVALFTRSSGLYIGELPSGDSDRVTRLASLIDAAGLMTIASPNIQSVEWSKFAGWLGVTAVSVLSRLYTHIVYQDPDLSALQVALIKETAQIAARSGVDLVDLGGMLVPRSISASPDEAGIALAVDAGAGMEKGGVVTHRMSALQDLLRGRRLEVEETYGWAVRRAAELAINVPALTTCYRLLAAIDRHQG